MPWEERHTGKTPHDDKDRGWSDVAVSQGTPGTGGHRRKRQERILFGVSEGGGGLLAPRSQTSGLRICETATLLSSATGLCYKVTAAPGNRHASQVLRLLTLGEKALIL